MFNNSDLRDLNARKIQASSRSDSRKSQGLISSQQKFKQLIATNDKNDGKVIFKKSESKLPPPGESKGKGEKLIKQLTLKSYKNERIKKLSSFHEIGQEQSLSFRVQEGQDYKNKSIHQASNYKDQNSSKSSNAQYPLQNNLYSPSIEDTESQKILKISDRRRSIKTLQKSVDSSSRTLHSPQSSNLQFKGDSTKMGLIRHKQNESPVNLLKGSKLYSKSPNIPTPKNSSHKKSDHNFYNYKGTFKNSATKSKSYSLHSARSFYEIPGTQANKESTNDNHNSFVSIQRSQNQSGGLQSSSRPLKIIEQKNSNKEQEEDTQISTFQQQKPKLRPFSNQSNNSQIRYSAQLNQERKNNIENDLIPQKDKNREPIQLDEEQQPKSVSNSLQKKQSILKCSKKSLSILKQFDNSPLKIKDSTSEELGEIEKERVPFYIRREEQSQQPLQFDSYLNYKLKRIKSGDKVSLQRQNSSKGNISELRIKRIRQLNASNSRISEITSNIIDENSGMLKDNAKKRIQIIISKQNEHAGQDEEVLNSNNNKIRSKTNQKELFVHNKRSSDKYFNNESNYGEPELQEEEIKGYINGEVLRNISSSKKIRSNAVGLNLSNWDLGIGINKKSNINFEQSPKRLNSLDYQQIIQNSASKKSYNPINYSYPSALQLEIKQLSDKKLKGKNNNIFSDQKINENIPQSKKKEEKSDPYFPKILGSHNKREQGLLIQSSAKPNSNFYYEATPKKTQNRKNLFGNYQNSPSIGYYDFGEQEQKIQDQPFQFFNESDYPPLDQLKIRGSIKDNGSNNINFDEQDKQINSNQDLQQHQQIGLLHKPQRSISAYKNHRIQSINQKERCFSARIDSENRQFNQNQVGEGSNQKESTDSKNDAIMKVRRSRGVIKTINPYKSADKMNRQFHKQNYRCTSEPKRLVQRSILQNQQTNSDSNFIKEDENILNNLLPFDQKIQQSIKQLVNEGKIDTKRKNLQQKWMKMLINHSNNNNNISRKQQTLLKNPLKQNDPLELMPILSPIELQQLSNKFLQQQPFQEQLLLNQENQNYQLFSQPKDQDRQYDKQQQPQSIINMEKTHTSVEAMCDFEGMLHNIFMSEDGNWMQHENWRPNNNPNPFQNNLDNLPFKQSAEIQQNSKNILQSDKSILADDNQDLLFCKKNESKLGSGRESKTHSQNQNQNFKLFNGESQMSSIVQRKQSNANQANYRSKNSFLSSELALSDINTNIKRSILLREPQQLISNSIVLKQQQQSRPPSHKVARRSIRGGEAIQNQQYFEQNNIKQQTKENIANRNEIKHFPVKQNERQPQILKGEEDMILNLLLLDTGELNEKFNQDNKQFKKLFQQL